MTKLREPVRAHSTLRFLKKPFRIGDWGATSYQSNVILWSFLLALLLMKSYFIREYTTAVQLTLIMYFFSYIPSLL